MLKEKTEYDDFLKYFIKIRFNKENEIFGVLQHVQIYNNFLSWFMDRFPEGGQLSDIFNILFKEEHQLIDPLDCFIKLMYDFKDVITNNNGNNKLQNLITDNNIFVNGNLNVIDEINVSKNIFVTGNIIAEKIICKGTVFALGNIMCLDELNVSNNIISFGNIESIDIKCGGTLFSKKNIKSELDIDVNYDIMCNNIEADEGIRTIKGAILSTGFIRTTEGGIYSQCFIKANDFIEAEESIVTEQNIISFGNIIAQNFIKSGGFIDSKGIIKSGNDYGIYAGLNHKISEKKEYGYIKAKEKPNNIITGIFIESGVKRIK